MHEQQGREDNWVDAHPELYPEDIQKLEAHEKEAMEDITLDKRQAEAEDLEASEKENE